LMQILALRYCNLFILKSINSAGFLMRCNSTRLRLYDC